MGMGLSIEATEVTWPEETVRVLCAGCGSVLNLTRWRRFFGGITPIPGGETEQLCPVCGTPACEEDEGVKAITVKNRNRDFFSAFRK